MKIVGLMGKYSKPLNFFFNKVHQEFPVDLLIVEKKQNGAMQANNASSSPKHSEKKMIEKGLRYLLFRLEQNKKRNDESLREVSSKIAAGKWFGVSDPVLHPSIPVMEVENINDETVKAKVGELNPDVMIAYGTKIISAEIFSKTPLALNIHWGLSPYYRGVNCTNRALLNWDPYNIGVTLHKLDVKIDGGTIASQARATVDPDEPIDFIPYQLSHLAANLFLKTLQKIAKGEKLSFYPQDHSKGYLCRSMFWEENIERFYHSISPGLLRKMLKYPSRGPLPIIE